MSMNAELHPEGVIKEKVVLRLLFLLVAICSTSFLTFVSRYLVSFSFFTAWHKNDSF
jgi:hypothetical protein